MIRSSSSILAALALTSFAGTAAAEPTAAEKETARALMAEGDKAFDAKRYDAALKAYRAADALVKIPTTGIWVAKTCERLGLLVEAREAAITVGRLPKPPGESAARGAARAEAEALARALTPRIPSVKIAVSGVEPESAEVRIDGVVVPAPALKQPYKVNPGAHAIAGSAPGYRPASASVTLKEGQEGEAALVFERDPSAAASASPSGKPARKVHPLIYAGSITGGAGLLLGVVTGALALTTASSAKAKYCNGNSCSPEGKSAVATSDGLAIASDVGFGVAAVGAGLLVTGLVLSRSPKEASARIELAPNWIGVRGEF
jgi:hypothetical protein